MLNYFDRRKFEVYLENLRNSIVDDLLATLNEERNSIDELEDTLVGAKKVLHSILTLKRFIELCDRKEILDKIDK